MNNELKETLKRELIDLRNMKEGNMGTGETIGSYEITGSIKAVKWVLEQLDIIDIHKEVRYKIRQRLMTTDDQRIIRELEWVLSLLGGERDVIMMLPEKRPTRKLRIPG